MVKRGTVTKILNVVLQAYPNNAVPFQLSSKLLNTNLNTNLNTSSPKKALSAMHLTKVNPGEVEKKTCEYWTSQKI